MASTDPTTVIILAEIVAVQTILILGVGIFYFIKKKKRAKLLEASIFAFEENITDRKQLLKTTFGDLSGNDADTITEDIAAKEIEFHRHVSDIFYNNDLAKITAIDQSIFDMVAPYTRLTSSTAASEDDASEQEPNAPDVDDAIDELLSDNNENSNDPALDLSDADSEKNNDPGIAEIPDELLNSVTTAAEDSTASDN